ncbi:FluC/FEX family fluoride channel Ecym_6031 [Eremothecium cymbalariae DBVPG|uniref:Fluoride export protein 1 n=1 Tax=Eremothecium cymbalariae (strain CBS 270.75 / DBVPG 7215 / KCTC 17166 / NRRL Y-17582) TaxID=931890 RepID=G8JUV7_ERECY|nr:hypothetical protein Ecym_6031 [Eremothecium cymbalariae DBVPG\
MALVTCEKASKVKALICFHLSFIFWVIVGTYTRVGLSALSDYDDSYIKSRTVLWSNFVACIFMGLLQGLNKREVINIDIFVCLVSGYCGTVSSYSSLIMEVFLHSTNLDQNMKRLPNKGYGIMEFLSVLIVQFFVSMSSFLFGYKLAEEFNNRVLSATSKHRANSYISLAFDKVYILSAFLAIPLVIMNMALVILNVDSRNWTLPALFAIFGSLGRFYLNKYWNPTCQRFYVGTFFANLLSTLILSILIIVERGKQDTMHPIVNSRSDCQILIALNTGLCGGLSTISSLIYEGSRLNFMDMLAYFASTVVVTYINIVLTLGLYAWTKGLLPAVC